VANIQHNSNINPAPSKKYSIYFRITVYLYIYLLYLFVYIYYLYLFIYICTHIPGLTFDVFFWSRLKTRRAPKNMTQITIRDQKHNTTTQKTTQTRKNDAKPLSQDFPPKKSFSGPRYILSIILWYDMYDSLYFTISFSISKLQQYVFVYTIIYIYTHTYHIFI
jgi:hypothetical protein